MRRLEMLRQDLRYAIRMMGRSPGFIAVAVVSLALGFGANTAVFSVINALMLRPLPVRHPEQLVELLSRYPGDPRMNYFGWKSYEHYRDHNHVFTDVIGMAPSRFQVSHDGLEAESVPGEYVVADFFPVLGIQPAIGRLIDPRDDRPGAGDAAVAVISWSYWQRQFNLSQSILTSRIVVDGVPVAVIGVAARGFSGVQAGLAPDVWLPAAMAPLIQRPDRRPGGLAALALIARLKPGVSIEQARAEMRVLDRARVEEIAATGHDPQSRLSTIEVEPAAAGLSALRDVLARPMLALMAIVTLLLLIACTNVASLLLARGAVRRRELALRSALGATRARLLGQLLIESMLLSSLGGLVGVALAYAGAEGLVKAWPFDRRLLAGQPVAIHVQPDLHVLGFTAAIALFTGVMFGLAPAWTGSGLDAAALRETGTAAETKSRRLFAKGLVVAQVALSVILLSGAGLFATHLSNLRHHDLGFDRDSVLLLTLDPSQAGYSRDQLSRAYADLLRRFEAIPGIRSATLAGVTPIDGGAASRFVRVEGFHEEAEARRRVSLNWVGPRYFETLGVRWVAGRDFSDEDEGRPGVAIVSQATARFYFGDRSAVGQRFTFDGQPEAYEIVGVVGDAKYSSLHEPPPRTIYLHAFQESRGRFSRFAIRTDVRPAAVMSEVRRAVRDSLKNVPVTRATTLAEQVDASTMPERLIAMLAGVFGTLGTGLAAIGLYGLLAYTVARRTNEIGVRLALGATPRDIILMVLKGALGLASAGFAVGAPIAFWSRRFAATLIEDLPVGTAYPIVWAAATIIAVALLAAYVPARRAARVDPMVALRQQ